MEVSIDVINYINRLRNKVITTPTEKLLSKIQRLFIMKAFWELGIKQNFLNLTNLHLSLPLMCKRVNYFTL